ncbi:MAG TPA: dolichyl-phosphate beta-glucosyltransferase [Chloroflexota bacterium]
MSRGEPAISHTDDANPTPYLSVVIPAFNEERRLPDTLDRLEAYLRLQAYSWEIVVVANGCSDRTEDVAKSATEQNDAIRLVSLRDRGKGLASKAGALRSRGEIIFLCDADLSMPPETIEQFLEAIRSCDLVAGSREAPGAHRYDEPWHRHLMGRVFNRVVQILLIPGVRDTQCGFKALRHRAARELFGQQTIVGWGFDVELLYLARKYGFTVRELPIEWYFDSDTRVRPGVDSLRMFGEVLYVRLSDALGHYRPRRDLPGTRREDIV